jgi:hypothetical protein
VQGLELSISSCDGHVVVARRGELALDFIECSSLGALLRALASAQRGDGEVVLAAPPPHARRTPTASCAWRRPPARQAGLLELFQLRNDPGPCPRTYVNGATAEFPPRNGASHIANTREQRKHDAAISPLHPQRQ